MADQGGVLANGGRVLAINAVGATLEEAVTRAYAGVDAIEWADGFCRRDIGKRAVFAGKWPGR
jgi:phosphoribosylamine--glycine ligase